MLNKIKEHYRQQGREEQLSIMIEKFESLHDEYYSQGDLKACDLVTDLVAYINDDWEALED